MPREATLLGGKWIGGDDFLIVPCRTRVDAGAAFDAAPASVDWDRRVRMPRALFKFVHDPATGHGWAHRPPNAAATAADAPISREKLTQHSGHDLMT